MSPINIARYCEFSKSNNSIQAENRGLMTASDLARVLGVRTTAVKDVLETSEWHHTSGWYNKTNYYDGQLLIAVAKNDLKEIENYDEDEVAEARQMLAKLLAESKHQKQSRTERTWTGCCVDWLEWCGSRNHPHATERRADNATVTWKGGQF